MVNRAPKGFSDNLSRRELQILCKKYGLPANRSRSDLAKSLVSFFEEGFGSSVHNGEKTGYSCNNFRHNEISNCYSCNNFRHNESSNSKISQRNTVKSCSGLAEGGEEEDIARVQTVKCGKGASPADNARDSSITTSVKSPLPFFEFYVRSEEGINLYVDLNSSTMDWTRRFKNEVHVCENAYRDNCQIRRDLGRLKDGDKGGLAGSFGWNGRTGGAKNDHVQISDNHGRGDQPDRIDEPLISSSAPAFNSTVDVSEHSKEHQSSVSFRSNPGAPNPEPAGSETCPTDEGLGTIPDADLHNTC